MVVKRSSLDDGGRLFYLRKRPGASANRPGPAEPLGGATMRRLLLLGAILLGFQEARYTSQRLHHYWWHGVTNCTISTAVT